MAKKGGKIYGNIYKCYLLEVNVTDEEEMCFYDHYESEYFFGTREQAEKRLKAMKQALKEKLDAEEGR